MMKKKQILISGMLVWFFAAAGTALVSLTEYQTHEQIIENERQTLLRNLLQLLPEGSYDNDLSHDSISIEPNELLGHSHTSQAYRARLNKQPTAIILNATTHNGYSGDIDLLVGIYTDGRIAGVRVVKHNETPGLGDGVDIKKSNWIKQFDLKSLLNPDADRWKVKRDGGQFDQMTGATITPRAVVEATHKALLFYDENKNWLFKPAKTGKLES